MEVGGGIRSEERIQRYLELGVQRCILGTVAVRDFDFTVRMAQTYGDQIAVGVDTRDGYMAVSGWTETSQERGIDFCRKLAQNGIRAVIYTDISRDGAGQGTNLEIYRELVQIPGLEITASGGIGDMEELRILRDMGVHSAITGKAIYTGKLSLRAVTAEFDP